MEMSRQRLRPSLEEISTSFVRAVMAKVASGYTLVGASHTARDGRKSPKGA